MLLDKQLEKLKEKLKSYESKVPINNMGKWSRSVAIEFYKSKIAKIESEISKSKIND